jgi:hypothetical protein
MKQFIIKLPENTELDSLSDEVKEAVKSFKGQFPKGVLVGSKSVDGYELKLIMGDITKEELNSATESLVLDWVIIASEGDVINQELILPYMLDTPIFDDEGEQTGSTPVTDVTGKLQTYSGRNWSY